MSNEYVLRFVGRFVFACEGEKDKGPFKKVTALGMDMAKYEVQPTCHRLFLTVQRSALQPISAQTPDRQQRRQQASLTVFGVAENRGVDDQLLLWDIDGFDLSIKDTQGVNTLDSFPLLPDLTEKAGGVAFDHEQWVCPGGTWLSPPRPVRMRFTLQGATITAGHLEEPATKVAFKEFKGEKNPNAATEKIADVVVARIKVSGLLVITLRRPGGDETEIVLQPSKSVITISNLCTASGSDEDLEFAAYYDILTNPPPLNKRLIPYVPVRIQGKHVDCVGAARVYYPGTAG